MSSTAAQEESNVTIRNDADLGCVRAYVCNNPALPDRLARPSLDAPIVHCRPGRGSPTKKAPARGALMVWT